MRSLFLSRLFAGAVAMTLVAACGAQTPETETGAGEKPKLETEVELPTTPGPELDVACVADPAWITSPSLPTDVPNGGETFCDFYQFAWQSYFYLMAPSATDASLRNFQVAADYPVMQIDADSCKSGDGVDPGLFVRVNKDTRNDQPFILPERDGQAGGGAVIYDASGNLVFYSVRFSRNLCTAAASPTPFAGNLPVGTLEMKLSWKQIDPSQTSDFISIEADIDGVPGTETLGMMGFHLAYGTEGHPEFVWASFEHDSNAPVCMDPTTAKNETWSMTSDTCADCIASPTEACFNACQFNQSTVNDSSSVPLTGTPTPVCRVYPEGSAPGDNKATENISIVQSLNSQLTGPDGLIFKNASTADMQVLAKYVNIGALWVSDVSQSSSLSNQRGSLQLENSTMETTFQGTLAFANGAISAKSDR